MRFYLGTHLPQWLATAGVPLFVSHRRLAGRRTFPRATHPWALDSGGFTELSMLGGWRTTPAEYVAAARTYRDEVGLLDFAAPQDWMCEAAVLAKTGLTVARHQRLTVDNYLTLRDMAPDMPWIPVLQGWTTDDYLRCAALYDAAGVDLAAQPTVGVGTVCRRQSGKEGAAIIRRLAAEGYRLHGFGFKTTGLRAVGHLLASADSMAWSYAARREAPLPGCTGHINCANCPRYALRWRDRLLGDERIDMKIPSATALLDAPEAPPETPLDNFSAALDFFRARFPELPEGSTINIRVIDKRGHARNHWADTAEEAARIATGQEEGSASYYGVNPRLPGRGDKVGVTHITALHCDLDFKAFDNSEEVARQALEDFDLEASLVVHSGGGYHVYYQLAGLLPATPENVAYAESLMQRMYFRLGSGHLDNVQDVSRVLRVPGTHNAKLRDNPRLVRVVHQSPVLHTIPAVERVLPNLPQKPARAIGGQYDSPDEKQLAEMLAHISPNLPYGDWVGVLMAVHSVYPDDRGQRLCEDWSVAARLGADQQSDVARRWKGFRRQGYSIGTVVKLAQEGGWTPPALAPIRTGTRAVTTASGVAGLPAWQRMMVGYPEVQVGELPPMLAAMARHIGPQAAAFMGDWAQLLAVTMYSTLFPGVRWHRLNLCLWFLGMAPQGTGKNRTSDELYDTVRAVWRDTGMDITPFTSGSTVGMMRRFDGENRRVFCYFREYVGFMKGLKSEHTSNLPELLNLIYDGSDLHHTLAKEEVAGTNPYGVVVGTTIPPAFQKHTDREEIQGGYLSRFWMCCPDCRDDVAMYDASDEERAALVDTLTQHLHALGDVRRVAFDTPGGLTPPPLLDYMAYLGVGTGRVMVLEEEMHSEGLPAGRLLARVRKVAALLELAEVAPRVEDGTVYVTERNVRLAIRLVQRGAAYARRALSWVSGTTQEGVTARIMAQLEKHPGGLSARELQQLLHVLKRDLQDALGLLKDDGQIVEVPMGPKKITYRAVEKEG